MKTGDAVDEGPVVLGRNANPAGTPRQETLHPLPLSGAQLVTHRVRPLQRTALAQLHFTSLRAVPPRLLQSDLAQLSISPSIATPVTIAQSDDRWHADLVALAIMPVNPPDRPLATTAREHRRGRPSWVRERRPQVGTLQPASRPLPISRSPRAARSRGGCSWRRRRGRRTIRVPD